MYAILDLLKSFMVNSKNKFGWYYKDCYICVTIPLQDCYKIRTMARMTLKICLVCGKEHEGTEAKITCSNACRTAMSRMLVNGKKPEYWLIAKGKGQKMPLTFTAPKIKKEKKQDRPNIKFTESTKESYDGSNTILDTFDEVGTTDIPLTKEQKLAKEIEIDKQISEIKRERCPNGVHPKSFKLTQEVKIEELKELLNQLK